jgi:hypothetical protein
MDNNKKGFLIMNEYNSQFCQIAVDMRFVTAAQVTEALAEQAEDSLPNKPHRPIGNIFFNNGWITNEQINFVYYIMHGNTAPL